MVKRSKYHMKSELTKSVGELNNSYNNKVITKQGIIKELSIEFQDDNFGFIQFALIQSFKMRNQQIGVKRDINVILLEDNIGLVSLGDKVQISGIQEVYNAKNSKKRDFVIVANDVEIINDEVYNHLTQQDITNIKTIAKQPLVQKNLANYIFHNIPIEEDIKLIGVLILFCNDSLNTTIKNIHSHISLLIVGASRTYKTTYLQRLRNLLPDDNLDFSQISDVHFTTYNSRYKKGGEICKKAGLADFAKNGIILIDNIEELKPYRLSVLDNDFDKILRKTSMITMAHTKNGKYYDNMSVYENLKFPRKNALLEKFDIILVATNKLGNIFDTYDIYKEKTDGDLLLSRDLFRKYLSYAKKDFNPRLTKAAVDQIKSFMERMSKLNKEKKKFKTLNKNKLVRVIISLSQSHARIALKNEVDLNDVQKIIEIYEKSLTYLNLI